MMKRSVILLVLLNIIIFAYFQLADLSATSGHQALPEIHPEKVQILSDQQVQELPAVSVPSATE
jgi:predicted RND superfamily exporter protein